MTEPVRMTRPEGEAARLYEEAMRLEQLVGDLVRHSLSADQLEEAERLRGLAKKAWREFNEVSAAARRG